MNGICKVIAGLSSAWQLFLTHCSTVMFDYYCNSHFMILFEGAMGSIRFINSTFSAFAVEPFPLQNTHFYMTTYNMHMFQSCN